MLSLQSASLGRWAASAFFLFLACWSAGCSSRAGGRCIGCGSGDAGPSGGDFDAGAHDAGRGSIYDARSVDPCTPGCGPTELCGAGEGDGLDNDCNGQVDETCPCTPTTSRNCFVGPPDRHNIGVCADGTMVCNEFGQWSACTGGAFPQTEVCDGADNDCDGINDNGLSGCSSTLSCPGSERATPLTSHLLRGSRIYGGAATRWRWTVECPPTVTSCPAPEDPNAMDTSIFFVSSGNYRVHVEVDTAEAGTLSCDYIVYTQGAGLRVELNWDTQGDGRGNTDVDLHLHRRSVSPEVAGGETAFFNADDCYFGNCKASDYSDALRSAWSMADTTDLSACRDAPHGEGAEWVDRGACYNPRLDVDVITCDPDVRDGSSGNFCAPENINVDNPPIGSTYRVMVNYYSAHSFSGETHPTVNIYCGGVLRGSFGADPIVTLRNGSGFGEPNDNWLVADIIFYAAGEGSCGATDCMIQPINLVSRGERGEVPFGPDWSF